MSMRGIGYEHLCFTSWGRTDFTPSYFYFFYGISIQNPSLNYFVKSRVTNQEMHHEVRKIWIISTHAQHIYNFLYSLPQNLTRVFRKETQRRFHSPKAAALNKTSNVFDTETVPSHIIKDQWRTKPQNKASFFHSRVLSNKRKSIVTVRFTSERSAYLGKSTALWHPQDVCAIPRSRSAQSEGKKSPPQTTQQ